MCTHEESRHGAKLSHLWLKALHEKLCWCISKSTSTENTFEEMFYSVKYLRAMLLITYLFLCVYDCTDSTLTNMNEWIHEELRVMCYIPHQRVKYCCFKKNKNKIKKALCISGTFLWCQRLVQWDETQITVHLCESKNSQLFHKDLI